MGAANDISQLLTKIKNQINNNTLIVGDFNTPLSALDRSSKQKIRKETRAFFFFKDFIYLFDRDGDS